MAMDDRDPKTPGPNASPAPDGGLTPDLSRRARELFDEVSQMPSAEAESFLETHGAEDPRVLSEVRDLLAPPTIEAAHLTHGDDSGRPIPAGVEIPSLAEGKVMGRYRIGRRLGGGGMGEVYEAVELDGHRQVALKIIKSSVASGLSRDRFLREGKLAASISHPNSVYVFGTDDADGSLVIAMELMPGGTLADVVRQRGPLPYTEAVDATLQVIAGLRAADARGVLHRDIKPANCFVDANTNVKIGDYGLSKPTDDAEATAMTQVGTVMGTPSFAPPEQLKGETVDTRSDLYAVGATLFFLLTGEAPFSGGNTVQVISQVLSTTPTFPAARAKNIPPALRKLVLRCMATDPAKRPQTYGELESKLEAFSSAVPQPAPLATRLVAGVIDSFFSRAVGIALFLFIAELTIRTRGETWMSEGKARYLITIVFFLYFAVTEGLFAATPGKGLVGLRVLGRSGERVSLLGAILRSAIFFTPTILISFLVVQPRWQDHAPAASEFYLVNGFLLLVSLVMFIGANLGNGWLGLHDRWTRTRVVARPSARTTHGVATGDARIQPSADGQRVAGFRVAGRHKAWPRAPFEVATDEVLGRSVWLLRSTADGAPPPAPASEERRRLSRPARLRWLAGSEEAGWEVYESIDGCAATTLGQRQSWDVVRGWLRTATEELAAGESSGCPLPLVAPEQIWVTRDGRLQLVEAGMLGLDGPSEDGWKLAQRCLARAASHALAPETRAVDGVPSVPLPLQARDLLGRLARAEFASPAELLSASELGPASSAGLGRRRAISIGLQSAAPLASLVFFSVAFALAVTLPNFLQGELEMQKTLGRLAEIEGEDHERAEDWETEHRALQVLVANGMRQRMSLALRWAKPDNPEKALAGIVRQLPADQRDPASRAVEAYPDPTADEIAEARATLAHLIGDVKNSTDRLKDWSPLQWVATMSVLAFIPLIITGLVSLVTAPVFRGGLSFKLLGLAVVRDDGSLASRWRCMGRAAIAWSIPLLIVPLVFEFGSVDLLPKKFEGWATLLAIALLLAGVTWVLRYPSRGPQDRLAGTWIVPR